MPFPQAAVAAAPTWGASISPNRRTSIAAAWAAMSPKRRASVVVDSLPIPAPSAVGAQAELVQLVAQKSGEVPSAPASVTPIRWGNGPEAGNTPRSTVSVSTTSANTPLATKAFTPPPKLPNSARAAATPPGARTPRSPPLSSRGYPTSANRGRYLTPPQAAFAGEVLRTSFGSARGTTFGTPVRPGVRPSCTYNTPGCTRPFSKRPC